MILDHLLRFTDEAAAQAALPSYYNPASDDGPGAWRGDVCIPGVSVYVVTGQQTITDPDTGQTYQQDVRQVFPGWFIVIALPALDATLRDLPDGACRLITDRHAGPDFLLYVAPDIDQATLAAAQIEPLFAGSHYPFGVG